MAEKGASSLDTAAPRPIPQHIVKVTLTPSPCDDQGFITPEICQELWRFRRDELDVFDNQIVQHRGKSKLKQDGSFLFSYAQEVADRILKRRK